MNRNYSLNQTEKGEKKMLVNLTGTNLDIYDENGEAILEVLPTMGDIISYGTITHIEGWDLTIPLISKKTCVIDGLPEPREGVILIVPVIVRNALPNRHDLASPGEPVLDGDKIVGCKGLSVNW
jgi:hypothetical protein